MAQANQVEKKLYRSTGDRLLAGVCGGFADYFAIDATLVRVLWLILSLANGLGILLYIGCLIIIPSNPNSASEQSSARPSNMAVELIAGIVLVFIGLSLFFQAAFHWHWNFHWPLFGMGYFRWTTLVPLLLIIGGGWLVIRSLREKEDSKSKTQPPSFSRISWQRSRTQRMVGGVLGGFAQRWDVEVSLVRIGFLILTLATHLFLGLVLYLALWVFLPEESGGQNS